MRAFPESDIEEIFIRSSGPGGQNVNKVSTGVWLRHKPTGLIVKCDEFRSQHQNRVRARQILSQKLLDRQAHAKKAAKAAQEKRRRQNRRRPQHLKEKNIGLKKTTGT